MAENIGTIYPGDAVVIDMDTGTVVGTNCRLVFLSDCPEDTDWDGVLEDSELASDVAAAYGRPLLVH